MHWTIMKALMSNFRPSIKRGFSMYFYTTVSLSSFESRFMSVHFFFLGKSYSIIYYPPSIPISFNLFMSKSVELGMLSSSLIVSMLSLYFFISATSLIPLPWFDWAFFTSQSPRVLELRNFTRSATTSSLYVSGKNASSFRSDVSYPFSNAHLIYSKVSRVVILFVKILAFEM